ncbi:type I secretion system permease/ATPase [Methylobacter sp. BBA5.1]|uniref:type I secretion system permease/ATPase n=1 Tax=Methylobacter sp. BBA5.1 TaxID=1495064 RepID=UPI00056C0060|nr:type I secretion system permease/ATPase [Methylobacter sp. BBA5.1]
MDTVEEAPQSTALPSTTSHSIPPKSDDALLLALLSICKLLHTPYSAEALTAGLPLVDNKLTPALFIRAAERAGLAAALVKRPLDEISNLVLPAVLILKHEKTCVLIKKEQKLFTVILPETDSGEKTVTLQALQEEYTGSAFLTQLNHQFDDRTSGSVTPKVRHWFWDVIYKSWPIYTEVIIASLLINLFALASPLFIMNVYDRVVPNHAVETLWVLAIGVAIVFTFDFVMKALRGYFIDAAGKRSDIILSATVFEKVMGIRMEAKPVSVGAFANNLQEFESFRDFLTSATLATLIDLPFLFIFLAIIAMIGGELALIPLSLLPLAIIGGIAAQKPLKRTIAELFKYSAQKGAILIESLSNLEILKTVSAEGQMQRQWEQNIGQIARLGLKSRFYSSIAVNLTVFLQQLASVAVVILGVYKIAEGELTTGGLIACTILTGRALAPIAQVASLLTRYHQAKASLASINRLMELPVEREFGKKFLHRPKFKGAIEFKNVMFSYPDQPTRALEKVSFKIKAGERVAFIGRIGSGKSTIEKLIMGLYEPQEGSILIDDTDIRQIDPSELRRQFGYVPQDISLMFGSVKDNITLGSRFAEDSAILNAAEIAGVTQFVNKHPAGFDMPVGERGASLSGGQRQSVAIARALLLAPPAYIMDEPTNSMDNSTEEVFKQRFASHIGTRTLILVTHRASLLSLVDRLIVMDGAHIVADGPKAYVLDALKQGQIKVSM